MKATGKQWYWSYSYPDAKFEFDSLMLQDKERKPDQPRLLAVDNEMVVPVNKVVRVQVIGADVIHAFAVPSFGIKIDAIPGRLNETWFKADREGIYYGQCSRAVRPRPRLHADRGAGGERDATMRPGSSRRRRSSPPTTPRRRPHAAKDESPPADKVAAAGGVK